MNVKLEDLNRYKKNESEILTPSDLSHIENYKNIISFFENAIANSAKEGITDYPGLVKSCLQCIRYLDGLINSYDMSLNSIQSVNKLIDQIVKDNTPVVVGNEELEQNPLSKEE